MPADDGFNGATIVFATAPLEVPLLSISVDESAAEVDVTGSSDSIHTYEAGILDVSITFEVVGVPDIDIGDEGAATVTWNDADSQTDTLTNSVVTAKAASGSIDSPITTSVTLRPTAA